VIEILCSGSDERKPGILEREESIKDEEL